MRRRARGQSDLAPAAQHVQTNLPMSGYGLIVPRDLLSAHSRARQFLIEIDSCSRSRLAIDEAQIRPRQIADGLELFGIALWDNPTQLAVKKLDHYRGAWQ